MEIHFFFLEKGQLYCMSEASTDAEILLALGVITKPLHICDILSWDILK